MAMKARRRLSLFCMLASGLLPLAACAQDAAPVRIDNWRTAAPEVRTASFCAGSERYGVPKFPSGVYTAAPTDRTVVTDFYFGMNFDTGEVTDLGPGKDDSQQALYAVHLNPDPESRDGQVYCEQRMLHRFVLESQPSDIGKLAKLKSNFVDTHECDPKAVRAEPIYTTCNVYALQTIRVNDHDIDVYYTCEIVGKQIPRSDGGSSAINCEYYTDGKLGLTHISVYTYGLPGFMEEGFSLDKVLAMGHSNAAKAVTWQSRFEDTIDLQTQ